MCKDNLIRLGTYTTESKNRKVKIRAAVFKNMDDVSTTIYVDCKDKALCEKIVETFACRMERAVKEIMDDWNDLIEEKSSTNSPPKHDS